MVSEGDPLLKNPYHVITVSPGKHPKVNLKGARQFVEFLTSPSTRKVISSFGIDKYGEPLFFLHDDAPSTPN